MNPKYGEVPPRLAIEVWSPTDRAGKITREITRLPEGGVRGWYG